PYIGYREIGNRLDQFNISTRCLYLLEIIKSLYISGVISPIPFSDKLTNTASITFVPKDLPFRSGVEVISILTPLSLRNSISSKVKVLVIMTLPPIPQGMCF